jgi:signal transduction histidine kinase
MADRRWVLAPVPDEVAVFDETEVRGAILNLVDNAVKATATDDTVSLSASLAGPMLRFSVEDSGSGIPEAERDAVLDRFARWGGSDPARTGLGLAIVNAVCDSHGGRVAIARSELGGAAVTMEIRRIPIGVDQ